MLKYPSHLFLMLILSAVAFSQQPVSSPPPSQPIRTNDENIIKVSTNLIQIDVVVTDKNGNQVTDLKPEDFEIYQEGKRQEITNFGYISNNSNSANASAEKSRTNEKTDKYGIAPPPGKLKLEKVRRTYAIVVDDLGVSFTSVYWVRQALQKFVKEQMQDGDLVAIIRTGTGIGALQSFTNDKRQLLAAIDKIKWNSQGRSGISSWNPIRRTLTDALDGQVGADGQTRNVEGSQQDKDLQQQIEEFRNENFAVGTLGALNYIIRGMQELPGRKSVMLVSEGFPLLQKRSDIKVPSPNKVLDGLRVLADLANRSSVVFYTIDPRGLDNASMAGAEDDVAPDLFKNRFIPGQGGSSLAERERKFAESQSSLRYLAYETGGLPFVNQNDINKGLQMVLNDQKGYYLIGYQPDEETFDATKTKFNNLTVKLKRDDLKVRYRSGFFNITDEKISQTRQNSNQKLASALVSPFANNELNIELYSFFYNDIKSRSLLHSLVYIDPNNLTFTPEASGKYQVKFDVIATVFDSNGLGAGNDIMTQTLKFTPEQVEQVKRNGLIYDLPVPINKPGAYQFRIALQDTTTGKIGAASQFVEIPNLEKKRLTLSNLVLRQFSVDEWRNVSVKQNEESNNLNRSVLLNTVIRRFRRPTVFTYSFSIYNAKFDPRKSPALRHQARLFYNGKPILEGQPSMININNNTDLKRIDSAGAITLGKNLPIGDYVLQVIVTDENAGGKSKVSAQSIDFEIVE